MTRVVVIGAGIGGLAVAARLAKRGDEVTIFESSHRTGGKCHTEWVGDYAFDTGPSLLTLPAVYRDLFLKTGKRLEHTLSLTPVNPAFHYYFADGKDVIFPNLSLHETCQQIQKSFGKKAAEEWRRLMRRAEFMWDVSREPFIESELSSPLALFKRLSLLRDMRTIAPLTSLQKMTGRFTDDQHLKMIVDRYATYSGSDPRRAPAVLLTIAFIESTFGAWHIGGGLGQLSVALTERVESLGGEIHLNTPVARILTDGTKATGVLLANGTEVTADVVIANADTNLVYNTLLDPDLDIVRSERRRLGRAERSFSGFSLMLGLDNRKIMGEKPPKLDHHSIFFPSDYNQEFVDIFDCKRPVEDPTIYICAPDDSKMVRAEYQEAWSVLVNAPCHDPENGCDWSGDSTWYAQKIIAKMDALGLRVSERLDVMKWRSPYELQNEVNAPGGAIYGTSSNTPQSAFLRARNRSPLKNLYCVGGSAHPGGGLPLVGISADITAEIVHPSSHRRHSE